MNEVLDEALVKEHKPAWKGGDLPFRVSYGKMMMWFFLITDTLTFSAFLIHYGFSRFNYAEKWPIPEDVFTHFPFLQGNHPLLFVALMTFILIMSSVTMVLAVNYGHKMKKNKVILWLSLTILGGILFLSSQAWEWGHFIHGDKGGIKTKSENIAHIAKGKELSSVYNLLDEDLYSTTFSSNGTPLRTYDKEYFTTPVKYQWINFDTYNHFVQVSPNQSSAVVTFNVDGEYMFKGIETDYAVRVSFFWTKINGEWKKMHSHWSSRSGSTGIPVNDRQKL